MSFPQLKPLILLCDGTWCGREASTKTNIYLLAKLVGIRIDEPNLINAKDEYFFPTPGHPEPNSKGKKARYIHGVGLGSTFIDYVFNGITAQDIAEQCISAYKYIVESYIEGETEIWMFGLSRGAYTVRCVAGMINNCGIVKKAGLQDDEIDLLCQEVYRIYRSPYKVDEPHSDQSRNFRRNASYPLIGDGNVVTTPGNVTSLKAPIRFMGLFDTVGELGIPSFTGGVGLDWPKFYDENVSSVVEQVYHAVSLHDRLYIFQPCLARRNDKKERYKNREDWKITEKWFPGVHYDLGRQRFKFLRDAGGAPWERLLSNVGVVSKVIEPNHVLADLALRWMLKAIKIHSPEGYLINDISREIKELGEKIVSKDRKIGDGDVYNRSVEYAPFGEFGLNIWKKIAGTGAEVNAIYEVLVALRDRHIPDNSAEVYDYKRADPEISTEVSVQELAGIEDTSGDKVENEKGRYPSRAPDSWYLRKEVSG